MVSSVALLPIVNPCPFAAYPNLKLALRPPFEIVSKMEVQCPPHPPTGDAPLLGLLDHLETQLERQIPAQLQTALQQALDDYQPLCDHCHLVMHRRHRYARAVATGYGEARLQIPVFRCGQCRRMAGGMTLLGDEMRHPAVFQKNRDIAISLAAQGLSYARDGNWVGCVKSTVCKWLRKTPLTAPELPPDGTLELDGL